MEQLVSEASTAARRPRSRAGITLNLKVPETCRCLLWELWLWAGLRLAAIKGPRGLLPARRLGAQPTLVFVSLESVLIKERVKPARPDSWFSRCRELWQGFLCCLSGATLSPQLTRISGAGLGSPGDHTGDRDRPPSSLRLPGSVHPSPRPQAGSGLSIAAFLSASWLLSVCAPLCPSGPVSSLSLSLSLALPSPPLFLHPSKLQKPDFSEQQAAMWCSHPVNKTWAQLTSWEQASKPGEGCVHWLAFPGRTLSLSPGVLCVSAAPSPGTGHCDCIIPGEPLLVV